MAEAMLSVEEARARILAQVVPLPSETVPLVHAAGRVLAEIAIARRANPAADVSAMDGYAVAVRDVTRIPATLEVSQRIPAGAPAMPLRPGTAARLFTGSVIPPGADAVVIQEDTEESVGRVVIKEAPVSGRHIRRRGSDFEAGFGGFYAGKILSPRDIGLAAAMNVPALAVRKRPRIAILATGDELVPPGSPVLDHQVIASSGIALAAAVGKWGAIPLDLGIARDDEAAIVHAIERAPSHDLLVTIGGASVGEHDLVRRALERLGFRLGFWKVAMRPGKPLFHGALEDRPVIGIPGNPVSALVSALLFVRPLVRALLACSHADGTPDLDYPTLTGLLSKPLPKNGARADFMRARFAGERDSRQLVEPLTEQDSSHLKALAAADCIIPRTPFAPPSESGLAHPIVPLAGLF